ncbi:hypothetical protein I316_06653 [Kwoniella heveanensis BCC8398]|uniref:Uncharacterized protein n=1 Tax=Kwoniella heveanensis BCC8398 TaxID=1296120 RepID=A0A1B9GKZ1_9TREE|nr:hypothetical protein I316_06653 [Kwoniella heveanensis BCC8398]
MPTLVNRQVDTNASATSSSSSSAPSSSSSPSAAPWVNGAPSGSTTLYLFTFLITILVLGLISSALLLRAYILRRRFHRRVEEALRAGRPLPPDAAAALGLGPRRTGLGARGKKEKKHGLMPTMWESEMRRDTDAEKWGNEHEEDLEDGLLEKGESNWDDLTPLSVLHFPPTLPPPPPEPIQLPPPPNTASILRSMFSTRSPYPERPPLTTTLTNTTIPTSRPVFSVPDAGTEIVVGVMIAMPVEEGSAAEEKWSLLDDGEERDLPEVCLGVMSAKIGE